MKEAFAAYGGQLTGDAPFSGRARKAARSRGAASSDAPTKHQRAGEAEVVDAEVLDVTAQVHLKALYATRGTGERIAFLFFPKESNIVKDMQHAGRIHSDMVENQQSVIKRKSTHLVLQRDAEGHRNDPQDQDWRFTLSRPEEGRDVEDAQTGHRG